ncbi:hypothetical protein E3E31_04990 [Thermococcus sp. M39]|uniref:hypothetical protein n=1 Tax=unclassified Thermococcus TaxID=2627626 RepID=UPI001438EF18|nr:MULTISPECIES: hypothetical protein [unclassified Thermococcus]NJE07880.1 hypothetical protein [Thermococcus sp. M39]NJE13410.1 hypothetical protein [Thermococcus sp. LS2]
MRKIGTVLIIAMLLVVFSAGCTGEPNPKADLMELNSADSLTTQFSIKMFDPNSAGVYDMVDMWVSVESKNGKIVREAINFTVSLITETHGYIYFENESTFRGYFAIDNPENATMYTSEKEFLKEVGTFVMLTVPKDHQGWIINNDILKKLTFKKTGNNEYTAMMNVTNKDDLSKIMGTEITEEDMKKLESFQYKVEVVYKDGKLDTIRHYIIFKTPDIEKPLMYIITYSGLKKGFMKPEWVDKMISSGK